MATTQPSFKIVKEFRYRGNPAQRWSNRYYFNGSDPANDAEWTALLDAMVGIEKALYGAHATVVEAVGYIPTSTVAAATETYSDAGTLSTSSTIETPGDCAAVLRQATTKISSSGRRVYVFSYYHKALTSTAIDYPDQLLVAQKNAIEDFGDALVSGVTIGARTYKRTTPDGHLVTGAACDPWVKHRDFPR